MPASRSAVRASNFRSACRPSNSRSLGKPSLEALFDALLDAARHTLGAVPILVGLSARREVVLQLARLVQPVYFRHVVNLQIEVE